MSRLASTIKQVFKSKTDELQNTYKNAELERAEQELKILDYDLSTALRFLKNCNKNRTQTPLYLIIGPSNFGKTTLLAHSGLKLLNSKYFPINQNSPATKYCVWWFEENATYLDTAGIYTKSDKKNPHSNLVWMGFLKLLRRYNSYNPIAGVLIVLDLPTLVKSQIHAHKTLSDLRDRIYEISQYTRKLPLFITFTKCDLITGFTDFFSNLDATELKQPFGITFTDNPQQSFNQEFDVLISNLNSRVITQLQKEPDEAKRARIKDFPQQLENLRLTINHVISDIPSGAHIDLHGMYFTSSLQNGSPIDYVENTLKRSLNLQSNATNPSQSSNPPSKRPYFIENLFREILPQYTKKNYIPHAELSWSQFTSIMAMVVFVIGISLTWYTSYAKNTAVIDNIKTTLQNNPNSDTLSKLRFTIEQLDNTSKHWWTHTGFSQTRKLSTDLKDAYYKAIAPFYITQLQKILETEIALADNKDYKGLYEALKVYLMLSDPSKFDSTYVQNWFNDYWGKNLTTSVDKLQQLKTELAIVLSHEIKLTPQPQIIAAAREALALHNIPREDLIFAALENKYEGQKISWKFADKQLYISKMYTAENFEKIYRNQIPEIAKSLIHKNGDWVFDTATKDVVKNSTDEIKRNIENAKILYFKNYVDAWDKTLKDVKIDSFRNVKQMSHLLTAIDNNNFPLLLLLKQIQINTNIDNAPAQFTKLADDKFQSINNLDLAPLYAAIANLTNYANNMANSSNVDKAAFMEAAKRFNDANTTSDAIRGLQKLALKQPQPIQSWLQNLSENSWHAILLSAQDYINNAWANDVFPKYQKTINSKYPLVKTSKDSIALHDFVAYFATNGIMDNFFNVYLQPFVDTNQVYWVWKAVDGQHLDISQNTLEIFIRATLIRKMYFSEDGHTPNAHFTLIPEDLSPTAKNFNLNLEGQTVSFTVGQLRKASNLVWPGDNLGNIRMEFTNNSGETFNTVIMNDPWALFRLLDKSNFIAINNSPQNFRLTFDLNGNSIKYQLNAEQPINPFIPGIIENFRCPEKL
jgi:type VI secretion system protein ImpL